MLPLQFNKFLTAGFEFFLDDFVERLCWQRTQFSRIFKGPNIARINRRKKEESLHELSPVVESIIIVVDVLDQNLKIRPPLTLKPFILSTCDLR